MRDTTMNRHTILVPSILMFVTACSQVPPDQMNSDACQQMLSQLENYDAIEWLKTPSAQPRLHGRMSDEEALALALRFQQLGADRLIALAKGPVNNKIPNDPSFSKDMGMLVQVPLDPKPRMGIFQLYAKHCQSIGIAPNADTGQRFLYIRWPWD